MMAFKLLSENFLLNEYHTDYHTNQQVIFSGKVNSYYTVIEFEEHAGRNYYVIKIGVRLNEKERNSEDFRSFTKYIDEKINPQTVEYRKNTFFVAGYSSASFEEIERLVHDALLFITEKFSELNYKTGDFFNGHDDETVELYHIAGSYFLLSEKSYKEREKENEQATYKNGLGSALKGALIGALISIPLCFYFYSFTLTFGYRNFGWLMGSLISIFGYVFHKRNVGFVSKKSVLNILGIVLILLILSIQIVIALDFSIMGMSYFSTLYMSFLNQQTPFIFSEIISFFLIGAIFAAICAFIYYRVFSKISKEAIEIEKVVI